MTAESEFERGVKEGRVDALLAEHSEHLSRINGSIERAALAAEALTHAVHELGSTTSASLAALEKELLTAIGDVASDVRTLNEDARLRDERVEVSRKTLAEETERRRTELADAAQTGTVRWTKRQQIVALILTALGLLIAPVALYLGTH